MRIVVTGATSFVGASTVREFLLQGHDVTAIVRPSSRTLDKLMLEEPKALERRGNAVPAGQLTIVENDLAKAQELVGKISEPCDVFCHFGWGGSGRESSRCACRNAGRKGAWMREVPFLRFAGRVRPASYSHDGRDGLQPAFGLWESQTGCLAGGEPTV